jgi:hypothetical protein
MRMRHRKAEAEKVLETALRKNNNDPDALLQRDEIYLGDRQFTQRGRTTLEAALKLNANLPEAKMAREVAETRRSDLFKILGL